MEKNNSDEQRKELAKFFYDLAKTIFTTMVLGAISSVLILDNDLTASSLLSLIFGTLPTTFLATIAYKLNNKK